MLTIITAGLPAAAGTLATAGTKATAAGTSTPGVPAQQARQLSRDFRQLGLQTTGTSGDARTL